MYGFGKIKASEATFKGEDGKDEPIWDNAGPSEEVWAVVHWLRFEDGYEVKGDITYLHSQATEDDARRAMLEMENRHNMTREEALAITHCFRASEEDFKYIDENFPNYQSEPDPSDCDNYDVYRARLKVMGELQPKTVELIKIANSIKDPLKRQMVEREAVKSYFAELAHYWTEDEVVAWLRSSNPVGTGGICEFAEVYHEPRRTIDPVNHELALNWLRERYNLLTAKELSESIFKKILRWFTPDAIKKRRDWLGLTGKRPPGPRPKSDCQ